MISLKDIESHPSVVEALDWPFDFSLERAQDDMSWIRLKPAQAFDVIAGEGTGGVFLAYGDGEVETRPILHATSEGQAGKLAADLTEMLALLMAIPYWRDLLKFSGHGDLSEMRRTATFMEREYAEEFPELPDACKMIVQTLPIPELTDPIQTLHRNVQSTDCTLVADDGWEYESLFHHFKSTDNPHWR